VIPKDTKMAFLSIFQMNQKFFDPNEDAMDIVTTQKMEGVDLADVLVGGVINEQVEEQNAERNQSEAFKDKGEGVKKPKRPEGQIDPK
jgi:hypothetical protein